MGVDNLWSQTLLHNKSYLLNFRRWNNHNFVFYYYYSLIKEKIYKINKTDILHYCKFTSFFVKRDATGKQIFVANLENNFFCIS
jgi:hypothetical protein